jgi:DNA polymerase
MKRLKKLKNLEQKIFSCSKCPGLNIPKETMSAPGYGDLNSVLFVVGQSLHSYNPNTPDRQIPFVGNTYGINDSGIILYKALDEAGYSFENKNLFVTNVVKCHPPKNRKSYKYEIENCKEYLISELTIIKPPIILALGSDAIKWFNLEKPEAGKYVKLQRTQKVQISAYHPSYINRYAGKNKRKIVSKYIDELVNVLKRAERILNTYV